MHTQSKYVYVYKNICTWRIIYNTHKSITYIYIYIHLYIYTYLSFPIFNFLPVYPNRFPMTTTTTYWVTGTLPPCKRVPNCPEGTKRLVLLEPAEIAEIGWCRLRRPKPRGEESWTRGSWDVSFFTQAPQPKSHFWEFWRIYGLSFIGG